MSALKLGILSLFPTAYKEFKIWLSPEKVAIPLTFKIFQKSTARLSCHNLTHMSALKLGISYLFCTASKLKPWLPSDKVATPTTF